MMVKTFWYSPGRNKLFLLGIAVCAVVALTAFGQIELNAWNKPFYDALSLKDFRGFLYQLVVFGVIAGALLALNVAQAWLRELSKLKLREGLTRESLRSMARAQARVSPLRGRRNRRKPRPAHP